MISKIFTSKYYHRPKIGLALSGGGARGLAHIGVLKVLEREAIPVDFVAGTSMGGVVAAAFAAGLSAGDLEQEALIISQPRRLFRLLDPAPPKGGLLRGLRLTAYFEQLVGGRTFADLRLPLAVVAVDLNTRREIVFREGSLSLALRATTSFPGMLAPVEINNWRLVDGGVLNNLPVDVPREMGADVVIAVDIGQSTDSGRGSWIGSSRWVSEGLTATLAALDETLSIIMNSAQEQRLRQFPPDIMVRPNIPVEISVFSGYERANELIALGERAAEACLPEVRSLLRPSWKWSLGRGNRWRDKTHKRR